MLSDESKRRVYDKYGKRGLETEGQGPGPRNRGEQWQEEEEHVHGFPSFAFRDPFDIFREFFGGADPFEEMMGGGPDPFDPFGGMGGPFGLMGGSMMMGGMGPVMGGHRHGGRHSGGLVIRNSRRQHPHHAMALGGFGLGLPGFGMGFGGGMFDDLDSGFGEWRNYRTRKQ